MKRFILPVLVIFISIAGKAQQTKQYPPSGYEAANWKTWLLDKPEMIKVPPAPTASQSQKELKFLAQNEGKLDDKKKMAIKFWDAGAPAYRWNKIVWELLAQDYSVMLRMPASWMNIAIYDASIMAWKEKLKYKRKRPSEIAPTLTTMVRSPKTYSYPCEHSVTAAAAAYMLAYFFPKKADSIMQMAHAASNSRVDAGVQFPSDIEAGWQLGEQVAKQIIEQAKHDGSALKSSIPNNKDPKKWIGPYPLGISLSLFKPIVIDSASQFRPAPPPDFEKDMNELRNFKQTFSSASTAYYWANASDTWSELAGKKMFEYHIQDDAPAAARVYTVLNTAYHDAVIAIFDAKYTYWGTRPNQYDSTYKSLIQTPPFPGYPSGHAAGAATSCAVLEYFFPADAKEFHQLAQDCADSRFYAGIHFRSDNEVALIMGAAIGKYVVNTWMKK